MSSAQSLRLSCGDHSFPKLGYPDVAKLIAMLGIDGIDVALMGGRSNLRPEMICEDVEGWADRVAGILAATDLVAADVFLIPGSNFESLAPNHPDPTVREQNRAMFDCAVDFASRIGAPGITTLPGIVWERETRSESIARSASELEVRAVAAADAGLRLSVEPHIGSVLSTTADVQRFLEQAPSVELPLDYGHVVCQDIAQVDVEPLLARARHIHARGASPGHLQVPVSKNIIDFGRIAKLLLNESFAGFVALEYVWSEWMRCNECDTLSETILLRDLLRSTTIQRSRLRGHS